MINNMKQEAIILQETIEIQQKHKKELIEDLDEEKNKLMDLKKKYEEIQEESNMRSSLIWSPTLQTNSQNND